MSVQPSPRPARRPSAPRPTPPLPPPSPERCGGPNQSTPPCLELSAVGRRWADPLRERPAVDALDGVDLVLGAGDFVCVEGPPGAGKSTLLLIAAGVVTPTSGTVRWAGTSDVGAVRPHRMRGRPWEYGALTVREALLHHAEEVAWREPGWGAPSRFVPLLRRVGLRGMARERLGALAPIDAFRVVVAQARLSRPGLLVADDVLAALPPADLPAALTLLRTFADEGVAVLLALRDATPVVTFGMAPRRARLEAGRLIVIDGVGVRRGARPTEPFSRWSAAPAATSGDAGADAPAGSRLLELEVAPASPAQWRRLVATLPSMQAAGRRWRIPLEGRTPEQVLARCREAGIGVRGSQVVERPG